MRASTKKSFYFRGKNAPKNVSKNKPVSETVVTKGLVLATLENTITVSNYRLGRASCKSPVHIIFCSLRELRV